MIHQEMDIDHEWVFLPENEIKDFRDGEKKVYGGGKGNSGTKLVFLTDYFNEEQPPPPTRNSKQVVPVSFPLEPRIFKVPGNEEDVVITNKESDKEVKTQVSFRKPIYTNDQSVDMTNKMDSPKSTFRGVVFPPQINASGAFSFDEKSEVLEKKKKKDSVEKKGDEDDEESSNGGINLWKWSLTGIGAICSFGVAAATFCFIVLGAQHRHRQQQQNQKMLFQRYADDRRMKQVVHHTTKINDAISAVRGIPITRAHITFGGYYDGL